MESRLTRKVSPVTGKNIHRILIAALLVGATELPVERLFAQEASRSTVSPDKASDAPRAVPWSDLAPENGRPFNDPFAKLDRDQLADLSYLSRIRRLIAEEKIDADGDDAKAATRLAQRLEDQGVEVNWLLVQSRRIPQIRRQQIAAVAKSVAESMDGATVEIVGFASPIPPQNQNVAGFLVMPTASMCGHATAPSPLHVALVETSQQYSLQSRGTPVRIRGKVAAVPKTTTMMTGSGAVVFESAYKILPSQIDVLTGVRGDSTIRKIQSKNDPIQTP